MVKAAGRLVKEKTGKTGSKVRELDPGINLYDSMDFTLVI